MKWDQVCTPKEEGGLGVKKYRTGINLVWQDLFSLYFAEADTLWIVWVYEHLLKANCFWTMNI